MTMPTVSAETPSRQLEAMGTHIGRPSHLSALGVLILSSQMLVLPPTGSTTAPQSLINLQWETASHVSVVVSDSVSELELFRAIDGIYEHLLRHATELDDESHRSLYQGRWDLYE